MAQGIPSIPTAPPDALLDALPARATAATPVSRRSGAGRVLGVVGNGLMALLALSWVLPLLWGGAVALRPPDVSVASGSPWWGGGLTLENFSEAFIRVPFGQYYVNTVLMVFGLLAVQLVTVALAGFAFARLRFPGRNAVFVLLLLQILVPTSILIVPNYSTIRVLGLFDTKLAVVLPFFASAFGTFFVRQTFQQIPQELDDASVIDGCRWYQTLWHVYIPNARPAFIAFGLVSVSFHWSDFLWPLIVTNSNASRPLTVGLNQLTQMGESGAQWSLIMAGTLLVVAPLLVVFLVFQRQFMSSFLHTGVK